MRGAAAPAHVGGRARRRRGEARDLLRVERRFIKGKTVVFTNAISSVQTVASALQKAADPARPRCARTLQQRQRLKALDAFEKHDDAVLVATEIVVS